MPKRGCAATVATPTAPPAGSTPSIQIIYAWHDEFGNRYEQVVEWASGYYADIMTGWDENWMFDQDFNTYYDPSETSAAFHIDPYDSTFRGNIATTC